MIVISIIGVLAATAIPSYSKYTAKTKVTEAYIVMGSITKAQRAFFVENNYFHRGNVNDNSVNRIKPGTVAASNGEKLTIASGADFSPLGEIVADDAQLNFMFYVEAGGFDNDGNALSSGNLHGGTTAKFFQVNTGSTCEVPASTAALDSATLGVETSPGGAYHWFTTSATGNFTTGTDGYCTTLVQTNTFDSTHGSSPFIQIN